MNTKIKKVIDDIERTKAKILELQTLVPKLERKRIDMENTEIIKLVRSADILPAELPGFLETLKKPQVSVSNITIPHGSVQSKAVEALDTSDSKALQDGDCYDDEFDTELAPEN